MEEPTKETAVIRVWPDAAKLLGLGRTAIYGAIDRGEIPVLKFGRRIVISRVALNRMLDVGTNQSAPST